ncbi:MAG: hypothetical protein HY842_11775 [Bacteroidetes bacterium]|nr:hypothetical protein [Bacteroidota bacterium]
MDKQSLLNQVRDYVSDAETSKALDLLEAFLKQDPRYKTLYREALHLSAQLNKARQDEAKSVISAENAKLSYGQTTDGILNLLDYIENNDFQPQSIVHAQHSWRRVFEANKLLIVIGLPMIVLAVAVLILVKQLGKNGPDGGLGSQSDACVVEFAEASENFLILPFYRPQGDEIQPEGLIIERLEEFCNSLPLKSDFAICENFKPDRLLSYEDADEKGRTAKAKVVIWGRAERGNNTLVVKTRFKYLGDNDTIPFTKLKRQGEQQVATDKVLSIITSSGELTQDLEATLRLIVGMVATLSGKTDAAIGALQTAIVTDSNAVFFKTMLQAENFIHRNEPEKAIAALDTCLATKPNYWLGRNNRASLRIEDGDYLGAIDDLTIALKKRPDDNDMLLARGTAYQRSEQLNQAREDFEKVKKNNPEMEPEVRKPLQETNQEIRRLENIVRPSKTKSVTKMTKQEVTAVADASNKLGDAAATKNFVAKGLLIDENDPKLIAIQVDRLLKDKELEKAKQVLEAAAKRKVRKEDIAKHSNEVATFINRLSLKKQLTF